MTTSIAPASGGPPSSGVPSTFGVRVSESDQEIVLVGILRPFASGQMAGTRAQLEKAARNAAKNSTKTLCVNLKRLKHMNNVAFLELNRFVKWAATGLPELKIKLIISSVIPWAIQKLSVIAQLHPNVEVEVYDNALYPIQQVIEDNEFINVLRTQSKLIWAREREILPRHGLRPGMRIADIGCGLGEFAINLQSEFRPEYVIGVDHSKPFLKHAQQFVKEFGLENIEYQYGDAATLLLADNLFDFVSCRLSLQVFDQPDKILKELYRICKPGGRVYLTNEVMSCITGYPDDELIREAYQEIIKIGHKLGMDMDFGLKTRPMLLDAEFEDVKIDLIEVNNLNADCQDLARVVKSWSYVIEQMTIRANASAELCEKIREGHQAHIRAILSERGFASWTVYAGSARKPYKVR